MEINLILLGQVLFAFNRKSLYENCHVVAAKICPAARGVFTAARRTVSRRGEGARVLPPPAGGGAAPRRAGRGLPGAPQHLPCRLNSGGVKGVNPREGPIINICTKLLNLQRVSFAPDLWRGWRYIGHAFG